MVFNNFELIIMYIYVRKQGGPWSQGTETSEIRGKTELYLSGKIYSEYRLRTGFALYGYVDIQSASIHRTLHNHDKM